MEENCVKQPNKATNDDSSSKNSLRTSEENHVKLAEENCVKPQNKSLMLADLLDKKESPALNGVLGKDLRIGEKGLELVEKAILKETHLNNKDISVNYKKDSVLSVNGDSRTADECVTVIRSEAKRPASDASGEETEAKRPKLEAGVSGSGGEFSILVSNCSF